MVNVGLPRTEQKAATVVDSTLLISFGLLILSGVAYAAVSFYQSSLETKLVAVNAESRKLEEQLTSTQARQVADFARRTEEIDTHITSAFVPSDTLTDLETSVLPEVTIKTFSYAADGEAVKVEAITDAVKNVARQMVAFKDTKKFGDVSAGTVGLTQDGKIQFTISMKRIAQAPVTVPIQ